MGFFNKNKETKKKEVVEVEEETMVETEDYTCDDCGKDFKESDLNDDGYCKACAKKAADKEALLAKAKETYCYKVNIEFMPDSEGNEDEAIEQNGLTEADAKMLYESIKTSIKSKEEYFEFPSMKQYDADEEELRESYPEYTKMNNVKKVYVSKEDEE